MILVVKQQLNWAMMEILLNVLNHVYWFNIIKSSEQSMIVKNTKCVNRDLIDNGKLKNTLPYNPYSLIFLFGCTKNDLIEMYKYELTDINKKIDDLNKNDNNFNI